MNRVGLTDAPRGGRWRVVSLAIVTVTLCAIYWRTAWRTVGPGDSGELAVVLSTWGVAHAPGFPLLSLVGNLVSHAVRVGEPALVLNLMNACFAALACGLLSYAVSDLTRRPVAGLFAGLALGTSRVFWTQALALEVFSLNALMAAVLLALLCRLVVSSDRGRTARRVVPAAVLAASTVVTHHLTLALLAAPALVALALTVRGLRVSGPTPMIIRLVPSCAVAALVGMLPLLYILVAAHGDPPINWGDVRDIQTLVHMLSRGDFGTGTLMSPGIVVNQILANGEAASPLGLKHIIAFLTGIPRDLGWGTVATMTLGFVWLMRRSRTLLAVVLSFLGLLVLFFTRVNTPMLPVYETVTEAFYVLPHLVLAFVAGCGVALALELAGRPGWVGSTIGSVAIATVFPAFAANWGRLDRSKDTFVRDFGLNLSAGMPQGSIFLNTGEIFTNSFLYQQHCLRQRRDVFMVNQDLLPLPWYAHQLRRRGKEALPAALGPPEGDAITTSRAWCDRFASSIPLVLVKPMDDSFRAAFRLEGLGIWSSVKARSSPPDWPAWEKQYSDNLTSWRTESLARHYEVASWEASEGAFYAYALGQFLGLRDAVGIISRGAYRFDAVPALDRAASWSGSRRADLLGFEADFLRQCIDDSLFRSDQRVEQGAAARATELARGGLAIDSMNVQSLHAMAAILSMRQGPSDRLEELRIRRRLVDRRPGDFGELIPYFRLAIRLSREVPTASEGIQANAHEVQLRLTSLLATCAKLDRDPVLERAREYWSQPLDQIQALH